MKVRIGFYSIELPWFLFPITLFVLLGNTIDFIRDYYLINFTRQRPQEYDLKGQHQWVKDENSDSYHLEYPRITQ